MENLTHMQAKPKIEVDIWSDIVCPFCYIGKRHFEQALEQAGLSDSVEVTWHSFELDPSAETKPGASIYEELGRRKGWSPEQSREIHNQVTEKAKEAGLDYQFDKTVPANSRNAHRLLHLAKKHGVQDDVKERLLKAYFTDGKNIDDYEFLAETGVSAGLAKEDIQSILKNEKYDQEIRQDIEDARKIGIQGVPFFVLSRKYAVSGAQPVDVFVQALKKVKEESGISETDSGDAFCEPDGNC